MIQIPQWEFKYDIKGFESSHHYQTWVDTNNFQEGPKEPKELVGTLEPTEVVESEDVELEKVVKPMEPMIFRV